MKKMRDVFYDMNDILVALIIVVLAAFVIISNINSILNYPSVLAESVQTQEEDVPTNYAENPPVTNDTTDSGVTTSPGTTDSGVDTQGSGSGEVEKYSVYVEWGATDDKIADLLIGVGLFKNRTEFYNAVSAAGAQGKLQAGTFIIPSDATPEEVIKIITD